MRIKIPIKLHRKLRAYVEQTDLEISGMGEVQKTTENGETVLTITGIRIFKQQVTSGNTILDRRALGKFYDDILREGKKMQEWKLWWHSHNSMGAFFSGTDTQTIEDFNLETKQDNWILALVTNHSGDTLIRCDIFEPIRYTIDGLELDIDYGDEEMRKEIKKEIEEKVTQPSFLGELWKNTKGMFFVENEEDTKELLPEPVISDKKKKEK